MHIIMSRPPAAGSWVALDGAGSMAEQPLLRKVFRQGRRDHPSAFTDVHCELVSRLCGMTNPWTKS